MAEVGLIVGGNIVVAAIVAGLAGLAVLVAAFAVGLLL